MKALKDMIKSALISIIMSITIFVIVGVIIDITNHGVFTLDNYMFSKMILACIFVGLGFGIPSIIYQFENIPLAIKTIIHLGIGLFIYFVSAINVGWIPTHAGKLACVITIIGVIAITLIIWSCFMIFNKNLAKKMNDAIQAKSR